MKPRVASPFNKSRFHVIFYFFLSNEIIFRMILDDNNMLFSEFVIALVFKEKLKFH